MMVNRRFRRNRGLSFDTFLFARPQPLFVLELMLLPDQVGQFVRVLRLISFFLDTAVLEQKRLYRHDIRQSHDESGARLP